MKTIVGVGGMPGTGKTTLMSKFINQVEDWRPEKPIDLLDSIYSPALDLFVLGKYQPWYEGTGYAQGTDRLSMAVQPNAIEFVRHTKSNVLFEGDRLFTQSFLELCSVVGELTVLMLGTDKRILQQRYEERNSSQSEQFIRSRETKLSNVGTNFDLMPYIEYHNNDTLEDQKKILERLGEIF